MYTVLFAKPDMQIWIPFI